MTWSEKSSPCAVDHFLQDNTPSLSELGHWDCWYLYNLSLNEMVQTHSREDKERLLSYRFALPFLGGFPLYFAMMGPSKAFYTGKAHMEAGPYLALCRQAFDRMIPLFYALGGRFAPFVLTYEASKQVAMFFTPGPRTDPEQVAAQVNRILVDTLSGPMAAADALFPALAALSGPIRSWADSRPAYRQAHALAELYFFEHGPLVLTAEKLQAMRRPADYDAVQEQCQHLMDALERGDGAFFSLLEKLMMEDLRWALSLPRVDEALSCLRARARMLCPLYALEAPEGLFDRESYLTLEGCHRALAHFFRQLFHRIRAQGGHSHCVVRALYFIHRNAGDSALSVAQIADYARVTSGYLSRVFSGEMGMAPVEYIKKCRMEKARRLLAAGELRIYQVAERVGFTDAKYFSRLFRQTYGLTPQQYRDRTKGGEDKPLPGAGPSA